MEQPDVNGYVNVKWPSKNVPHGGIFHTKMANSTQTQQEFLKVLLDESKLSMIQRQKVNLGLRQYEKSDRQAVSEPRPLVRPRTSRRRSLSAIRASGIFDDEIYCPLKRGEDREKMIEKLANVMAFGDPLEQQKKTSITQTNNKTLKLPTSKEKWNELVTQIRERADWLAEMEYLGEASPHRDVINDQIAERMRALDGLGIDSECSSTRSTASGFSTTRSTKKMSVCNSPCRTETIIQQNLRKQKTAPGSAHRHTKEENVEMYKFSPLQYSPRRRV